MVGLDGAVRGSITERSGALEDVCECMARRFDRKRLSLPRRNRDVKITWISRDPRDRSGLSPEVAAHYADDGPVVVCYLGNLRGGDVLVARSRHFQRGG